jgi:hypothetical protein
MSRQTFKLEVVQSVDNLKFKSGKDWKSREKCRKIEGVLSPIKTVLTVGQSIPDFS